MSDISRPTGSNPFTVIPGGAGAPTPPPASNVQRLFSQPTPPAAPEDNPEIRKAVRRAASQNQTMESALLAMVNAAGVSGPRAEVIASAIMANDDLRAEAQRAFDGSGLRPVD